MSGLSLDKSGLIIGPRPTFGHMRSSIALLFLLMLGAVHADAQPLVHKTGFTHADTLRDDVDAEKACANPKIFTRIHILPYATQHLFDTPWGVVSISACGFTL